MSKTFGEEGIPMEVAQNRTKRVALNVAVFASVALFAGGFTFVCRDFGFRFAAVLSLLLATPLLVSVRLRRRWIAVRGREVTFLAVLFCAAAGGAAFVVRALYADGFDLYHAEDLQWAEFERQIRRNPAFRGVMVHKTERKNIHWASGTVSSQSVRVSRSAAVWSVPASLGRPTCCAGRR